MNKQAFFDSVAETWDKRFETQELLAFLQAFVPQFGLQAGDRVLDVGTGTGRLIPFLLQAIGPTGHVTAIDYSERMVAICKSKYANVPNITIQVKDVEELDFPAGSFDAIICFGVFPHIESHRKALRRINRVLKVGGKLVIAHALSSEEIREHHYNASPAVAHDFLPAAQEMRQMLMQTGFGKIRISDRSSRYLNVSYKIDAE